MGNNLKTIVYLTTNIINKKIYVGVHDTETPEIFDGYIGNGININYPSSNRHPSCPFHYAVKKYGFDNFIRSTIKVFDNREDALKLEKLIVDDKFIARKDTYNIVIGGGDPPKNAIPVYQYDLNGTFIRKYNSIFEASKLVNGAAGIRSAINYKTTSGGYLWSDIYIESLDPNMYYIVDQKKEIYLYHTNGILYKKFNSISETLKELKVSLGPVQRAIITKTKIKGYYISDTLLEKFIPIRYKKHNTGVYQYSLDGEYLNYYKSCLEVARLLGKQYNSISHCIRLGKPCGGYQWSWEKVEKMAPYKVTIKTRKVGQFTLDGKLVKTYNTVRECRKEFGNVSRVLKGLVNKCKGYTFKYID